VRKGNYHERNYNNKYNLKRYGEGASGVEGGKKIIIL
jgi:hypothetical protein